MTKITVATIIIHIVTKISLLKDFYWNPHQNFVMITNLGSVKLIKELRIIILHKMSENLSSDGRNFGIIPIH